MALFDWLHKWTQRFDSRRSKFKYDSSRGVFERDEGLPAGHSNKLTALLDPVAGVPITLGANIQGFITMAQFSWVTGGGGNERLSLVDVTGQEILSAGEFTPATLHNEAIGDGSGVIAQWTGALTPAVPHGGPPVVGSARILITYYTRPIV